MKPYIIDLKDITDSQEMLEARPHFFLSWFGAILLAILTAALTWAYFGELEEHVKATGSVRPEEQISTIKNRVSGPIEQIHIAQGTRVKQGTTLYTIQVDNLRLARDEKIKQIAKLEMEIDNLTKFRQSVYQEQNLFNPNHKLELDYYNLVRKYLNDRKLHIEQITNSKLELEQLKIDSELSIQITEDKLEAATKEYNQLKTLLASVEAEENLFSASEVEYYNRYENYISYLRRLTTAYEQQRDNFQRLERLFSVGSITKIAVEEACQQVEIAKAEMASYRKEYIINLQGSLKQSDYSIKELTSALAKITSNLETQYEHSQSIELMIEKNRLDMLVQIEDNLRNSKTKLEALKNELRQLELNISEGQVKAAITGVVNLHIPLNQGDLLQSGVEVASIMPEDSGYLMQLMVSNENIAHLREGQRIKYRFLALSYREYGELQGEIKTISADSRVDNLTGINYYLVEASVDRSTLASYKGDIAEIKAGMVFEARIITKTKKILVWLLEKINLLD